MAIRQSKRHQERLKSSLTSGCWLFIDDGLLSRSSFHGYRAFAEVGKPNLLLTLIPMRCASAPP